MNETMKKLFKALGTVGEYEDPFTTTEIEIRIEQFHAYFKDKEKTTETDDRFMELADMLQMKAFEAGFHTAIDLLMR